MAEWVRITKSQPSINDTVERYHIQQMADENYVRLWDATTNAEATEGLMILDDGEAAKRIREAMVRDNNPFSGATLATIIRSLGVVLRRYGMAREQRRVAFNAGTRGAGFTMGASAPDEDEDEAA